MTTHSFNPPAFPRRRLKTRGNIVYKQDPLAQLMRDERLFSAAVERALNFSRCEVLLEDMREDGE